MGLGFVYFRLRRDHFLERSIVKAFERSAPSTAAAPPPPPPPPPTPTTYSPCVCMCVCVFEKVYRWNCNRDIIKMRAGLERERRAHSRIHTRTHTVNNVGKLF